MATIESGARFQPAGIPSELCVYCDMCACHCLPMTPQNSEVRSW